MNETAVQKISEGQRVSQRRLPTQLIPNVLHTAIVAFGSWQLWVNAAFDSHNSHYVS